MSSIPIYTSPLCSCIVCHETKSAKGIHSHYLTAHTEDGNKKAKESARSGRLTSIKKTTEKYNQRVDSYNQSPKLCKQCKRPIAYKMKSNTFCCKSCGASYNNAIKDYSKFKPGPHKQAKEIEPVYSKLQKCICKHCGKIWMGKTSKRICKEHSSLYSHAGRAQYWFTFNVFHYPDLFDLDLLQRIGFRSKINPNGITRDHRVSVNEAITNNYNPYYIKHVMNCELMIFSDNAKKHTNSSISYEELIKLVDEYDSNHI